jgi:hypothetical protein
MKLQTSQDYDVDNRYQETDGPNGSKVSDNNSGKRFLNQYIEKSKDANEQNITPERREDNRFVITGPGDSTYVFKNSFRAPLFNR